MRVAIPAPDPLRWRLQTEADIRAALACDDIAAASALADTILDQVIVYRLPESVP
jgi:hypothetical protein